MEWKQRDSRVRRKGKWSSLGASDRGDCAHGSRDQPNQADRCRLDRLRACDASARDELLNLAYHRLSRLAHKMLCGYPGVRRWEQTDDVLQNAMVRLCRASRKFNRLRGAASSTWPR